MASTPSGLQTPPANINIYGGDKLIAISITFLILTCLFTGARYTSRQILKDAAWGIDDLLVSFSCVACLGMCALGIILVKKANVGYHVEAAQYRNPESLINWGKTVYAICMVYLPACALPKLAILALYKRIFTDRFTSTITWIVIGTVVIYWAGGTVAAIVQCTPIPKAWDHTIPGHCINIELFFKLAASIPIITTDIPMLLIPFPSLWKLNASRAKKLGLSVIFLCGGIGVAASPVRFALFLQHSAFTDPTWSSVELIGWSIIEPCMYHIASCLLAIRPLLLKFVSTSTRVRAYVERAVTGRRSDTRNDSLFLDAIPGSQGRSKGFASLPDRTVSEEELIDSRQSFKRNDKLPPSQGIGVRKDVWVIEAEH